MLLPTTMGIMDGLTFLAKLWEISFAKKKRKYGGFVCTCNNRCIIGNIP